jgi:threonine dehydrogenase-like Zn-dependent dehydrogenase
VSEDVDTKLACLCEPVAVCLRTANIFPLEGDERDVAIIGAGILGITTGMILKNRSGYRNITIIDRNEFKLEICRNLGFQGIHFKEIEKVQESFGTIVEACGAIPTYHASLKIAAPQATIVWMGNIQDKIEFEKAEISSILRKELVIRGTWNSVYQNGVEDNWGAALDLIQNASWLNQIVSHIIPLDLLPSTLEKMYHIKKHPQLHHIMKAVVVF